LSAFFICMDFFVYILQSEESGAFYKGATDNLARRLGEHNAGQVDSTRPYRPWNLVWYTSKPSRSEALVLERKLKNLSVLRTIDFIKKYPVNPLVGGPDVAPVRQSGC